MRRAALTFLAICAVLVVTGAGASAQPASSDDDLGFTIPTDGLFHAPGTASWFSNYIGLWWLIPMIGVSMLILWIARWINDDAHRLHIPAANWNYQNAGLCFAALVAFFLIPPWISLPATLVTFYFVLHSYIPLRNQKCLATRRLFTPEHYHAMKVKVLGACGMQEGSVEKKLAKIAETHLPVTLFFQSGQIASPADASPAEDDPATSVKAVVGQALTRHAREADIVVRGQAVTATYLIDGIAHSGPSFDLERGTALIHMTRTLVKADSPSPQFRVQLPTMKMTSTVEVRVYGGEEGEWLRLRLRADSEELRKLADLGMAEAQTSAIRAALEQGKGMIAVASPQAMGARTTLYAMLDSQDPFSRNITTYERPVTGRLASIEQNDLSNLPGSFAEVLADKARQDYDLFMLSEVPDRATAEIALKAPDREQLFIARFELSDSASVVAYLLNLGVDPELLSRGLHAVVGQRLVRVLCRSCRRKVAPPVNVLQKAGVDPTHVNLIWEESAGCDECGMTGFSGRTGIFEIWQPSAAARQLIAKKADVHALHAAALRDRMTSLQHAGLEKVLEGVTSLRELARVLKVGHQGS